MKKRNKKYKPKEYQGKSNIINIKELEKYNIVEIDEDITEVREFLGSLEDKDTIPFYLPLDEFCIKYNEAMINGTRQFVHYAHIKQYKNKWGVKIYTSEITGTHSTQAVNTAIFNIIGIPETKEYQFKFIKDYFDNDTSQVMAQNIIFLLSYICYIKDNPNVDYTKQDNVQSKNRNKDKNSNTKGNKLNVNNKDYKIVLGDKTIRLNLKPNEIRTFKRKYVRMIESWSVMGHVRHYRNGKTVFIKPYIKGKARNKQDETTKRNYVVKRNKK